MQENTTSNFSLFESAKDLYTIYQNIDQFAKIYFQVVQNIMLQNQYDLSTIFFNYGKKPHKFPPYITIIQNDKETILLDEDMPYTNEEREYIDLYTKSINTLLEKNSNDVTLKAKAYFKKYLTNYYKKYQNIKKMLYLPACDIKKLNDHVSNYVRIFWQYYKKGVLRWLKENEKNYSQVTFILGDEPNFFPPPIMIIKSDNNTLTIKYEQLKFTRKEEENISVYSNDIAFNITNYPLTALAIKEEFEKCAKSLI